MPLIHRRELHEGAFLGIWEVTENETELLLAYPASLDEVMLLNSFSHPFRRGQFLASRLLLHTLLPDTKIVYDENGKPFPNKSGIHLSLSHSAGYIVMMIDEKKCGVDIEVIRPKIEKIASKFLSEEELVAAKEEPATERLHVYWCVKEALYKVHGKKNVSLRRNIFVEKVKDPASGTITATLTHDGEIVKRDVHYDRFRDCMLAWTEQK